MAVYDAGNGKTGVERAVTILGRDLTLKATGTVSADGGQLLIEPETVDLGGPAFLDSAASALARSLATIRQDVPGVPEGMSLTAVEVTDAGFAAADRHRRVVSRLTASSTGRAPHRLVRPSGLCRSLAGDRDLVGGLVVEERRARPVGRDGHAEVVRGVALGRRTGCARP